MGNSVLIIGGNHQNPLGVTRALGERGVKADIIIVAPNVKSSFVLKSKYVHRGWIVDTYERALEIIREYFPEEKEKTVAYACCDDAASFLDMHLDELQARFILPGMSNQGQLTKWTHKDTMCELAAQIGLNVPPTWLVTQNSDLSIIEYPCVTKSISSVGNGKKEFTICASEKGLRNFLESKAISNRIQVEKYIDIDYEFQYFGCSLPNGDILMPGRSHIPETHGFNNITYLCYDKIPSTDYSETMKLAKKFVGATGYRGLFSVEFMRGKDGKDYFLEMNFRNDGNALCVTRAGTNLPFIYYLAVTGGDYMGEVASSTVETTYSSPEDSYFMSMVNGDIPFKKWWKNMRTVNCWITYDKNDSAPFWHLLWLQKRPLIVSIIKRLLGKNGKGKME